LIPRRLAAILFRALGLPLDKARALLQIQAGFGGFYNVNSAGTKCEGGLAIKPEKNEKNKN